MDLPICREGDDTSHGGKVTKVSGSMSIDGRRNARLFDWVSCPQHGDNQIIEGSAMLDDGLAVVLHACKTACGSTIVATGHATVSP